MRVRFDDRCLGDATRRRTFRFDTARDESAGLLHNSARQPQSELRMRRPGGRWLACAHLRQLRRKPRYGSQKRIGNDKGLSQAFVHLLALGHASQ